MKRIERFSVALLVAMLVAVCFLIGLDIQRKFVDKTALAPLTNLRLEVVNQAPNVGVFEVSNCYVLFDENPAYNPGPTRVTNRKNGYYQYQYYLKGSGWGRHEVFRQGE